MGSPPDGIVFVFEQQILYQIEGCFSKNVRKILYVIRNGPESGGDLRQNTHHSDF
jgi:hypothetical protein